MAKDYDIARSAGQCVDCGRTMEPDEEFVAAVVDAGGELTRRDYCTACWGAWDRNDPNLYGVWRSRVPRPAEKKKQFVDNEVLVSFFDCLEGAEEPARVSFRFVLALVLMRKKLLAYDGLKKEDDQEIWRMHFRNGRACEVVDPKLDEEKIAEVSAQLGQIMETDL